VKGSVDDAGRALVALEVRKSSGKPSSELTVWIDTAFTGELVVPRESIEHLGLPQSSAITASLADGSEVVLDTYSCIVKWFDEERLVEVVENAGKFPLLGIGMLQDRRLEIDYRSRTVVLR
jgi:clan AA aspartic protease